VQTGEDYTCETGILPGHHPKAITNIIENYQIFFDGDFTEMTSYLRGGGQQSQQIEEMVRKFKENRTYG
jgi:hypothetical protein